MTTNEPRYVFREKDGKESFPLTMAQIASRAKEGIIKPDTILSSAEGEQKTRAGDVPNLAEIFKQKGIRNVPPAPVQPVVKMPVPSKPIVIDPSKAASFYVEEASRQYKQLNWWLILGVVFVPGFFGIFMVIYACVQKPALRRRVAELGVDPVLWAAPLDADMWRNAGIAGLVVTGGIATLIVVNVLRSLVSHLGR